MRSNALKSLGLAMALLAAALAAARWRLHRTADERLLPRAARAVRLELTLPGGDVARLERRAEGWRLTRPFAFAADAAAVDNLLAALARARLSAPLGARADKHGYFGVTAASAARITAWFDAAAPALDLLIGREGASHDTAFARRAGSDEIFEVRGLKRKELLRSPGQWADRLICAFDPTRIGALTLERAGTRRRYFAAAGWEKARPVLDMLQRLQADRVLDPAAVGGLEARGLERPEYRLEIGHLAPDGAPATTTLVVGPRKPGFERLLRVEPGGRVYAVADWRVKALTEIIPSPLPN